MHFIELNPWQRGVKFTFYRTKCLESFYFVKTNSQDYCCRHTRTWKRQATCHNQRCPVFSLVNNRMKSNIKKKSHSFENMFKSLKYYPPPPSPSLLTNLVDRVVRLHNKLIRFQHRFTLKSLCGIPYSKIVTARERYFNKWYNYIYMYLPNIKFPSNLKFFVKWF